MKMANVAKYQCPVCHAKRVEDHRPFCSKRCAELDLGRWFAGTYAVPFQETPDEYNSGFFEWNEEDGSV